MSQHSPLYYRVLARVQAERLRAVLDSSFQAPLNVRKATVVSATQIALNGQRYELDTTNTTYQPGQVIRVRNVQRLASAVFAAADGYGGPAGGGGGGGGGGAHTILSSTHTDSDVGDTPVAHDLLTWESRWTAQSLGTLIRILGGLWIGRKEGAHIGLFYVENQDDDRAPGLVLQATNHGGVPFLSVSYRQDHTNSARLRVGQEGHPQITLETPTATDGQPDELVGVVVPVDGLDRLILPGDIDLDELAAAFYLAHGTTLPAEPLDYPAGNLRLLQAPGDTNLFVLYVRDHLDNWQMIGGAGYMAPHTHTSADTGGLLPATVGFAVDTILTDANGTILVDASGNVLIGD